MKLTKILVKATFTEPLLGSQSNNPAVLEEFQKAKAPTEAAKQEEITAVEAAETFEKQKTVFPRDEKGVFLWDYQVRGFLKESISVLIELGEITGLSKWICKKAVDSLVFVKERRIYLKDASGNCILGKLPDFQRPLRAQTMQGERIALAASEVIPEGAYCQFTIELLEGSNSKSKLAALSKDDLIAALNYGALKGFGQWRSGGFGRFKWEELAE